MRKVLKSHKDQPFFEKPDETCTSLITKLQYGRANTAKIVLGHYIGNRMIGIKKIAVFKIFVADELKTISLNERKAAEKSWSKVLTDYCSTLDKFEERSKSLKTTWRGSSGTVEVLSTP